MAPWVIGAHPDFCDSFFWDISCPASKPWPVVKLLKGSRTLTAHNTASPEYRASALAFFPRFHSNTEKTKTKTGLRIPRPPLSQFLGPNFKGLTDQKSGQGLRSSIHWFWNFQVKMLKNKKALALGLTATSLLRLSRTEYTILCGCPL